jgi:chemotaxis protein CheD
VGGLSHFLLPDSQDGMTTGSSGTGNSGNVSSSRYANSGFELMLSEIRKLGLNTKEFEFKLFGGGAMPKAAMSAHQQIGSQIVAAARQLLTDHQLPVAAEHTGGIGYRHLMFDIWSGQVWLKYVALDVMAD